MDGRPRSRDVSHASGTGSGLHADSFAPTTSGRTDPGALMPQAITVGDVQRILSAPDIDFDAVRTELGVSEDYGTDAQDEADHAVDRHAADREDRTDLPFVTIDPPTSKDLDQAVHLTADDDGFVVDYAGLATRV